MFPNLLKTKMSLSARFCEVVPLKRQFNNFDILIKSGLLFTIPTLSLSKL
jgi:hypothetical protein